MTRTFNDSNRDARKRQKLGPGARCIRCGEREPSCLEQVTLCRECRLEITGKSPLENHHVLGQRTDDTTVAMPANIHAEITGLQGEQFRKIEGTPRPDDWVLTVLKSLHATVAAFLKYLDRAIDWLEALFRWLPTQVGPDWLSHFEASRRAA